MWGTVLSAINGIITLGLVVYLIDVYRKTDRYFYFFWGLGFLAAGFRIILRTIFYLLISEEIVSKSSIILFLHLMVLIFIVIGLGDLVQELKTTVNIIGGMSIFVILIYLITGLNEILVIPTIGLYLFLCFILPYVNTKFSISINYLMIGIGSLFFIHTIDYFQVINNVFIEFIGIIGKTLIFVGMLQPKFKFLAYDISGYLSANSLGETKVIERYNTLVILKNNNSESKRAEIKLFADKLKRNTYNNVKTILIVIYDLITIKELSEFGIEKEDLYIVRMLSREKISGFRFSFDEYESVIRDNMEDLNIVLTEIIEQAAEKRTRCEIYFYNLSTLIHLHGIKRIYSFMISKFPKMKSSKLTFYAYIHPDTHENETPIALIESLADKIQKI